MSMLKEMIRRWLLDNSAERANDMRATVGRDDLPSTALTRTFSVHEALNGSYITFQRRKYNPNGPDEFRHEIYIVQPGETLIDAISTVLVLTEK
jgi:hypothetical protein